MLDIFITGTDRRWYWYVITDNQHVLDQGVTRTEDTARNEAHDSRNKFSRELNF